MIAATLVGLHLKVAAGEGGRGTSAAEMDEGGEILGLARAGLHIVSAREHRRNVAIEIDRREFDRMARDGANVETRKAAAAIRDRMIPDAELGGFGERAVDHLEEADGARRRLIDRERI